MPGIRMPGNREIGTLFDSELWWRDQYRAIESLGYILRPRYHPNWRPSWKRSGKDFFTAEDGQPTLVSVVCQMLPTFTLSQLPTAMDAMRAWDGKQVMFKKVPAGIELEISQFLTSPGLMQEPNNHCVPLLEILELPDVPEQKLIVMPFLRPFDNPRFQTFGEFVSFFEQICDVRLKHHRTGGIGIPNNPLPRVSCSCTNEISRTGGRECLSLLESHHQELISQGLYSQ